MSRFLLSKFKFIIFVVSFFMSVSASAEMLCENTAFSSALSQIVQAAKAEHILNHEVKFFVVKSTVSNAYAFDKDKIFFTTSLLSSIKNSDFFAAILFHEIGHIELNHLEGNPTDKLMDLFFSSGPSSIIGLYGKAQFSQDQEIAADLYSVKSFAALGLDPYIVGRALLEITYGPSDSSMTPFYSHPIAQMRKDEADHLVPSLTISKRRFILPKWDKFNWACNAGEMK